VYRRVGLTEVKGQTHLSKAEVRGRWLVDVLTAVGSRGPRRWMKREREATEALRVLFNASEVEASQKGLPSSGEIDQMPKVGTD
jgi:hypothetical protein